MRWWWSANSAISTTALDNKEFARNNFAGCVASVTCRVGHDDRLAFLVCRRSRAQTNNGNMGARKVHLISIKSSFFRGNKRGRMKYGTHNAIVY